MAEKTLFQIYKESNKVSRKTVDRTGQILENCVVIEFVRRAPPYFIWKCKCSCGAEFEKSSKDIVSHPDLHCGSVENHSKWHDAEFSKAHFLSNFSQGDPGSCWEWQGNRNSTNYGRYGDKNHLAHRLSYEHFKGPIPEGLDICHKCDNPPCVNPHHLYAGTKSENMRDKHRRARHWPFALTPEDVKDIRAQMAVGMKYGDYELMADKYGCDKSLLHLIKNNRIWPEVPWPDGFNGKVPKLSGGTKYVLLKKKS